MLVFREAIWGQRGASPPLLVLAAGIGGVAESCRRSVTPGFRSRPLVPVAGLESLAACPTKAPEKSDRLTGQFRVSGSSQVRVTKLREPLC
jgi:hypothetical protein